MGGGPQALSNFEYAGTLTEAMLLGNIAVRTGKRLEYDGQRGVISNSVEANALIKPQMRAGWSI
jgi:pimeloyl-CoA synthetase